jgi:hypothetical protein
MEGGVESESKIICQGTIYPIHYVDLEQCYIPCFAFCNKEKCIRKWKKHNYKYKWKIEQLENKHWIELPNRSHTSPFMIMKNMIHLNLLGFLSFTWILSLLLF